jgi:hypothetical protein
LISGSDSRERYVYDFPEATLVPIYDVSIHPSIERARRRTLFISSSKKALGFPTITRGTLTGLALSIGVECPRGLLTTSVLVVRGKRVVVFTRFQVFTIRTQVILD